jgi:predicted esterase
VLFLLASLTCQANAVDSRESRTVAGGLMPGEKVVLPVELNGQEQRWIKSSGLSGYETGEAAIALPREFDPATVYPILVTCVTGDRYLDNIEEMDKYWPQAVEAGWVVITGWADPHPDRDTRGYRRAVTVAALHKLAELIPESRQWPVAVGGFSGGAKTSAITAAYLQKEGYRIIGLFMGGCNEDLATTAMRKFSPDKEAYLSIPIFLSTGTQDRISTVEQSRAVVASMRKTGFQHLRLETYDGSHRLHKPHIPVALKWFEQIVSAGQARSAERP